MTDRQTARQLLVALLAPVLGLMLLLGIVGVVGVYRTNQSVTAISRDINPVVSANDDYLELITDAETALRGWSISGDDEALEEYSTSLEQLVRVEDELHALAADAAEPVAGLVAQQSDLGEQWVDGYAEPRVAAGAGLDNFDAARFATGQATFVELRAVNSDIEQALDAERLAAVEAADTAFWRVIIAMVLLTAVAGAVAWLLGRRLRLRVEKPLAELERTVQALSAGDTSARARVGGPREIAAVAQAINAMAAENEQAQQVENRTRDQLLALDQAKSDFISNVSHELRTPLTSVKGYLELLRDEADPQGPAAQPWDIVDRNVDRLGLLVEDLLTLANVESRHTTLVEIDVRELVEDVAADLRIAAANRGITMTVDLPPVGVRVLADKVQLLRAILNVVSNAVKFCRDDGRVDIRLVSDGQDATLTVRDTGIGIPADQLANLGSRFFRASNAVQQQIGGTGLGVRMVQTIITKHGGRTRFESAENEYTLVTITLPVRGRLAD